MVYPQSAYDSNQIRIPSKSSCRVSVVIPTYNRASMIASAIESLLLQTFCDFEIIVVDDGSSDDTKLAMERFKDQRLIYIRHEHNRGGAAARNTGIRAACGEFIAFLDSDDQWSPVKLERQMALFDSNDRIGVVYTGLLIVEAGRILEKITPFCRGKVLNNLLCGNCINSTSSIMVRKSLLLELGGFDEKLRSCQDWDLYIRLAQRTSYDYLEEGLVFFNQHPGDRISTNPAAVIEGHLAVYAKYRQLSKEQGKKIFCQFNWTIAEILAKKAYFHRSRPAMKQSRAILKEAFGSGVWSTRHFLLYCSTYLHFTLLDRVYFLNKKIRGSEATIFSAADQR